MIDLPALSPFSIDFPNPEQALTEPNGLLALGGDLAPQRLISAYKNGIFPWYNEDQPILWWTPDPRAVLLPKNLRLSRSLRKTMRNKGFEIRVDTAFSEVIRACANSRDDQGGTWINEDMLMAYEQLHRQNVAHSVEVYSDNKLAGGLYGISIGKLFFGESMFTHVRDASKVAFAVLVTHLSRQGFPLIDCQLPNPHLASLGATNMARKEFRTYLEAFIPQAPTPDPWKAPWPSPAELFNLAEPPGNTPSQNSLN